MENKSKTRRLTVAMAIFVRLLLMLHTLLATWRVTLAWDDNRCWLLSFGVIFIALEGYVTISVNKGIEWKWICPCFAIYLGITLPLIWMLEVSQMNKYLDSQKVSSSIAKDTPSTTNTPTNTQAVTGTVTSAFLEKRNVSENVTVEQSISGVSDLETEYILYKSAMVEIISNIENILGSFNADTWVVVVEESLVYLIVIGGWLLPRGGGNRKELSDLLIEYLGMASDIMELFALFDEDSIRGDRMITYAILAIWSISFVQFVPVMKNSVTQSAKQNGGKDGCCSCGESFPEIFVTLCGLFLQDGPFLGLRLFIIFYLQILTYSLMFFVLKNIIVVLLLTYRLGVLCCNLPIYQKDLFIEGVVSVDVEHLEDHDSDDVIIHVNTTDSGQHVFQIPQKKCCNQSISKGRTISVNLEHLMDHDSDDVNINISRNQSGEYAFRIQQHKGRFNNTNNNGGLPVKRRGVLDDGELKQKQFVTGPVPSNITGSSCSLKKLPAELCPLTENGRSGSFNIFDEHTPGSLVSNERYASTSADLQVDARKQPVRASSSPDILSPPVDNKYSVVYKAETKPDAPTSTSLRTVGITGSACDEHDSLL